MFNRSLSDNLYTAWKWFVVGLSLTTLVKSEPIEFESGQCTGGNCQTTATSLKALGIGHYTPPKALQQSMYESIAPKLVGEISIKANPVQQQKIQSALIKVNNENTLKQMVDAGVSVHVLSETDMLKLTDMADCSACFVASHNSIYINTHVFANDSPERADQLTTLLANEVSHASVFNAHPAKSRQSVEHAFKSLVPWTNPTEKTKFVKAYDEFKQNVDTYQKLSQKSKLNASERKTLKAFDNSIKSFIPPRLGKNASTAKQERISFVNGKLSVSVDKTTAPAEMGAKRIAFLRDSFFAEIQNKIITTGLMHQSQIGIYQGSDNQNFADLLSDFETLSPQMRQTFGPSLCQLLDGYHHVDDHCQRPQWS